MVEFFVISKETFLPIRIVCDPEREIIDGKNERIMSYNDYYQELLYNIDGNDEFFDEEEPATYGISLLFRALKKIGELEMAHFRVSAAESTALSILGG